MNDMSLKTFAWSYRAGVAVGILVAVLPLLGFPLPSLSLLVIGVTSVLALAALAFRTPPADRPISGSKVQTAGYLYTLIGFSALLILMGRNVGFSMAEAIGPLGSALLTSILGWFLGGEIIEYSGKVVSVRSEAERIAAELQGFSSAVRRAHDEYISAVGGLASSYKGLHDSQREAMKEAVETATHLSTHLSHIKESISDFDESMSHLSKQIQRALGPSFERVLLDIQERARETEAGLKKTALAAADTSQYLSESRRLIEELEKLLEFVHRARRIS